MKDNNYNSICKGCLYNSHYGDLICACCHDFNQFKAKNPYANLYKRFSNAEYGQVSIKEDKDMTRNDLNSVTIKCEPHNFVSKTLSVSKLAFPEIKNVIFNPPATIVFWSDNTKTVVKCSENDIFDPEKGLAMAISKKFIGNNKGSYFNEFKKWTKKYEEDTVELSTNELVDLLNNIISNTKQIQFDFKGWEPKNKIDPDTVIVRECANCMSRTHREKCTYCVTGMITNMPSEWEPATDSGYYACTNCKYKVEGITEGDHCNQCNSLLQTDMRIKPNMWEPKEENYG